MTTETAGMAIATRILLARLFAHVAVHKTAPADFLSEEVLMLGHVLDATGIKADHPGMNDPIRGEADLFIGQVLASARLQAGLGKDGEEILFRLGMQPPPEPTG